MCVCVCVCVCVCARVLRGGGSLMNIHFFVACPACLITCVPTLHDALLLSFSLSPTEKIVDHYVCGFALINVIMSFAYSNIVVELCSTLISTHCC